MPGPVPPVRDTRTATPTAGAPELSKIVPLMLKVFVTEATTNEPNEVTRAQTRRVRKLGAGSLGGKTVRSTSVVGSLCKTRCRANAARLGVVSPPIQAKTLPVKAAVVVTLYATLSEVST